MRASKDTPSKRIPAIVAREREGLLGEGRLGRTTVGVGCFLGGVTAGISRDSMGWGRVVVALGEGGTTGVHAVRMASNGIKERRCIGML